MKDENARKEDERIAFGHYHEQKIRHPLKCGAPPGPQGEAGRRNALWRLAWKLALFTGVGCLYLSKAGFL